MPLYPILSYTSYILGDFHFVDILLSSATPLIIMLLSLEIFKSKVVTILSGILTAVYPFSIYYASSGLTETSFVLFLLVSFLFLYKQKPTLASIFLVISLLIRPTLDYLNPILILLFCLLIYKNNARKSIITLGKYFLVYMLMMSPWWFHNHNKYGQFVRFNLGFGEMIYGGNNPYNPEGRALPEMLNNSNANKINDPIAKNQYLTTEAFNYIKENKLAFVKTSIKRFFYFINPIPNHSSYKSLPLICISFVSIISLYVGLILFLFYADKNQLLTVVPIFLFIVYLTFIHSITIASIRYRFPIEPFLILFLAFSLNKLFKFENKPWVQKLL